MKNIILKEIKTRDLYLKKILILYDQYVGVINEVLQRFELEKYGLRMYQCLSCNTVKLFNLGREISSGGLGVATERNNALIACLGEAIERYCVSFVDKTVLLYCRYDKLPVSLKIKEYELYSDDQYVKYKNIFAHPKRDKVHWVVLKSVWGSRKKIAWPASLIYMPFENSLPVAEATSTGLAAHTDKIQAINSGILEVIERDSIMICVMNKLPVDELEVASIIPHVPLVKKVNKDYKIKIFRITSKLEIPTYLSIIYKKYKKQVHYGIGASTSLNTNEAIEKALKECLFTFFYSKKILPFRQDKKKKINKLYEHFLFYQGKNFSKLLELFPVASIQQYKPVIFSEEYLCTELKKNGMGPYYIDITTNDVKKAGLCVVKVVIPGTIDLQKTFKYPRLAASRFVTVPRELGFKICKDFSNTLHPFP